MFLCILIIMVTCKYLTFQCFIYLCIVWWGGGCIVHSVKHFIWLLCSSGLKQSYYWFHVTGSKTCNKGKSKNSPTTFKTLILPVSWAVSFCKLGAALFFPNILLTHRTIMTLHYAWKRNNNCITRNAILARSLWPNIMLLPPMSQMISRHNQRCFFS